MSITESKSAGGGARNTARRRGGAAGGRAGQLERTSGQRHRIGSGDFGTAAVSPRVTRLRISISRTRQHVTRVEIPARRRDGRRGRTICRKKFPDNKRVV